jgi:lipopolysaccharide transport system ATP-binding protein
MSDLAIFCHGIGKQYQIGERESYKTLRDVVADAVKTPFRRMGNALRKSGEPASGKPAIWALKDVSFQVKRGDVVGIIGRNGAGKSTLLKILSRITKPTQGYAEIAGRVGSLLEVGTGFHPELTGRENIFLNGAILGMKRAEITRKFDEIVAFAEVEKFIDTPVKHYSSGMYVRLAFAVAAHLETEVLFVDEVLAVGDFAFQKKCLGKMSDAAKEGRTVVFVSHNMGAVNRLCSHCMWLDGGSVHADGVTSGIVNLYIREGIEGAAAEKRWTADQRPGDDVARLRAVRICQPSGVPCAAVDITRPFDIEVETEHIRTVPEVAIGLMVTSVSGDVVLHTSDQMKGLSPHGPGVWISRCQLPAYTLNAGMYLLTVGCDVPNVRQILLEENLLSWLVEAVCPAMGRYAPESWKGFIGPGLPNWSKELKHEQAEVAVGT